MELNAGYERKTWKQLFTPLICTSARGQHTVNQSTKALHEWIVILCSPGTPCPARQCIWYPEYKLNYLIKPFTVRYNTLVFYSTSSALLSSYMRWCHIYILFDSKSHFLDSLFLGPMMYTIGPPRDYISNNIVYLGGLDILCNIFF